MRDITDRADYMCKYLPYMGLDIQPHAYMPVNKRSKSYILI